MRGVLSQLSLEEVDSLIILDTNIIEIDPLNLPELPEISESPGTIEDSGSESSDDALWNLPIDVGNLYIDQELPEALEVEINYDPIPSPDHGVADLQFESPRRLVGVDFNLPIFIRPPPRRNLYQALQEILDEEDDYSYWDDLGYHSD